eukprot:TRINITY_DN5652_c0_g1_i1.p2 TRINITY_DN5652_c0_g1~~TRINITY_DN5652_c0_g1_i1.p2  ORF type:complete len:108 (-),score=19.64 TRINITY_DN5652_c0_g1_i1:865-1143(-)
MEAYGSAGPRDLDDGGPRGGSGSHAIMASHNNSRKRTYVGSKRPRHFGKRFDTLRLKRVKSKRHYKKVKQNSVKFKRVRQKTLRGSKAEKTL